jgi:HPt (histidine-containing phosphotransfer) domain-containing protein
MERDIMVNTKDPLGLSQPVFDYDDFLHRIDGDVDLLKEVVEIFLEDTPGLLADLYSGIKTGDAAAVERATHTLKGASANISAKRLQALSQKVQVALKENGCAGLESFIVYFEENFKQLDRVLQGYLVK